MLIHYLVLSRSTLRSNRLAHVHLAGVLRSVGPARSVVRRLWWVYVQSSLTTSSCCLTGAVFWVILWGNIVWIIDLIIIVIICRGH